MANQLANEISPYLLQHKDNPVHWLPWGEAAFALAKLQHKPVLISIGYAACHWCHVMAHESFEDAKIAEILNQHFICIKVDREERPDVDAIYMSALQLMQIPGGWPLHMFVTPAAKPFFGGTYFPPRPMFGRPSFAEILKYIVEAWHNEPDKISEYTESMQQALCRLAETSAGDLPNLLVLESAVLGVLSMADLNAGGLRGAPKFPQLALWLNVLNVALHSNNLELLQATECTAQALCQGGIYDHLGGGLSRYATDEEWLVPHFEKMLYDNAQLLELLTRLWQKTGHDLYRQRVAETIAWLEREMLSESGALAAAVDADSEGEEGKYYVWSLPEIDQALGADADIFKRAYQVSATGNWQGHNILQRRHAAILTLSEAQRLPLLCEKLLAVRAQRIAPHRDDKVLADWNGLAIASLARAAMVFAKPQWLGLAVSIYENVRIKLGRGKHLLHAYRAGQAKQSGLLDDYAAMIHAALMLYQASGELAYLQQAEVWTEVVDHEFADAKGGYFTANRAANDLIVRLKSIQDQALPAANGLMAYNLAMLYYVSGKAIYRETLQQLLQSCAEELNSAPLFHGTLMRALSLLERAVVVVVVGKSPAMLNALWQLSCPELLILPINDTLSLPSSHPAQAKTMIGGQATAYICRGQTCGYPITDIEALVAQLKLKVLKETA